MRASLLVIFFCFIECIAAVEADGPPKVERPEAISELLKMLDADDDNTVLAAYVSLREYYCYPPNWGSEGPVVDPDYFDRESLRREVRSWQFKFNGKSRRQILLARLGEEPTCYTLKYVPEVLTRDEAIDYLIDWASSNRQSRVCGLHSLHGLTGLDLLGAHTPDEESIAFACSYWKQVKPLGHSDRTRLQAIGRLLALKRDGRPVCDRLSESEARKVFLESEARSIQLWQQRYELLPTWGKTLEGTDAYRSGTVASHQYRLLVGRAKVNSPNSIALLTKLGEEHKSAWLRDSVRNLLHNVEKYPESIMEDPISNKYKQDGPLR